MTKGYLKFLLTLSLTSLLSVEIVVHLPSVSTRVSMNGMAGNSFSEQSPDFLQSLVEEAQSLRSQDSEKHSSYLDTIAKSDADRAELVKQRFDERKQIAIAKAKAIQESLRQQEELEEQVKQEILDSGGIDIIEDDEVYLPDLHPTSSNDSQEGQTEQSTSTDNSVYLGQFKAKFVPTCADCFDNSVWENVEVESSFILADPEYISPGTRVTLDEGSTATYAVHDSQGAVSGRNIIVFDNNHSETQGNQGMILYPKVYSMN